MFKSGYHDMHVGASSAAIREVGPNGECGDFVSLDRHVSNYLVWDWQTRYRFNASLVLTGGLKNIFDRDPPFSQRIAGGGNQMGFDARYTDPLGRQAYLVANYKF